MVWSQIVSRRRAATKCKDANRLTALRAAAVLAVLAAVVAVAVAVAVLTAKAADPAPGEAMPLRQGLPLPMNVDMALHLDGIG